jgi:hypothetical protein
MDVRLPDGTIITNVPEGTTQSELMRRVGLMAEPPKEKGFLSNIGSLIYEGGERAIGAAKIAPSVVTGNVGVDKAKLLSQELSRPDSVRPAELVEAQSAFKDEAAAFDKAKGFMESVGPVADMLLEFGKQVVTNPKGAVYLAAQSAANMAPQIAGIIAGGKTGMLLGPKGAAVGAIGGGFAAGAPLEIGSEFIGRISEKLSERGLPPTEENIAALLRDKMVVERAISEARTKGVTTAAVDSLMTVGAGKFATGARRSAIDAARKELGDVADAAQIAKRADDILKARTLTQKVGRGAGAVGIETAGGGISEAVGQLAAYGEVDLEDVGAEMLGELGGSAVSVPAAAYSLGKDKLKEQARGEADRILKEEAEAKRVADEAAAEKAKEKPLSLGMDEPFKPVVFPDGSVATTPEDVVRYEEQQFEERYKPQPKEKAADVVIPEDDNYALLVQAKERLRQQETPEAKKMMARIDERLNSIVLQDVERISKEADATKTAEDELKRQQDIDRKKAEDSVFGQEALPEVESRDVVVGNEALANLQAKETPVEMTDFDLNRVKTLQRKQPRPTTEEDAIAEEQEKDLKTLLAERNKIKTGGNLYRALEGQLNASEVNDISPDIKKLYGKGFKPLVRPGGQGTDISELVDDGLLNNFLPDAMKRGAETYDVQESAEHIKNKLRTKDTRAEVSTDRTRELDAKISYLSNVVGERENAAKAFAEVEPGEAATVERAAGDQVVVESTDQIRYKRATGKVGIGKQAVQDTVDAVKARWANAPEVVVAENMDDPAIPQEVRDHNKEAVAKGAKGRPQGFYYKGKAYVIADSIGSTNEAVEALMHEALGHFGLRGVFGPKMEAVLRDVIKNRRTEVESKAKQYGLDPKSDKDMLEAAEEVLAVMAQTKPGLPFVKRALVIIRDFLRSLGFNIKMSDADIIQKYILPARAFVESGKGRPTEGKPAAMRASAKAPPTDSAAFNRWFGDSKVVDENGDPLVVYHGTNADITEFKNAKIGARDPGFFGKGFYFTPSEDDALNYADSAAEADGKGEAKAIPVYLSLQNPFVWDMEAGDGAKATLKALRDMGLERSFVRGDAASLGNSDERRKFAKAMASGGYDGVIVRDEDGFREIVAFSPTQIKSATGNIGTYDPDNADIRYQREAKSNPNQAGQANLGILDATGMQLQPPDPSRVQKIKDILKAAGENPAMTKDSAKSAIKKFLDKMEVAAFSGDAAFNNDIRRNLEADFADNPDVLGMLLEASQSQAVHADALATQFIVDGGIAFDPETKKWVSIKKEDNFIKLAKQIEKSAEKYGLNKEQTEQIAHTYFVAKRFKDLLKKQNARDTETDRLNAELEAENANIKQYKKDGDFEKLRTSERAKNDIKADIAKLEKAKVLISEDQRAMIEPGLSLVKNMPELEDISDTWQGIRANAVKAMIDGGLWSRKYAESMLDNAAYVPFYRDEQLDEGGGPQEFIRGLQVKAEEFRLKGSNAAVNDVFDNMVRWTQYAINRSVRNHKALQMVDLGTDLKVGDRKMAEKVKEMDPKKNTIRVFRDGTQEIYSMADPLYVDAFSAISNVTIPSLKFFSWFSNLLRQSVVLYPLFSLAQIPQDSISAMFTSGLKTRYALRIPVLAVKEFLKTLNKTSSTHNLLKSYGATGVRDFNATVARTDIQITAGLKGSKGVGGKTVEMLSHIAMAADNSIRQAVYEASMQQGLSKREAIEKAFDIINFRRRGTSKLVNLFGQTVPFFYAYMSVQRTAYKTLTLVGISPQKRKEALNTLATTSGAVMALSLFYVMMNGGDEEYEKTPTAIRDRTLNIPGTGGLRIPLRPDLFLMPKVLTEHLYHLITDTGFSDGAKFRKSVFDGIANAVLSPQPIPQAIKPAIEVGINYDFFQGRPLIGQFEKQKEAERQFNDNTSEFSKMLGQFGVSPIAADHMIRGMFGSAGGLFLYTTNFMINSDPDVPRPDLSFRDAAAALPGTSGFVTKASESALKTDFYALRDEVEKVKNTYNDIKLRSPQELEQFLSDEKNIARLGLAKGTEKIGMQLSKIRKAINQITNAPEDLYSASEKKDAIKELREVEKEMLKSVDIPGLRKMAMM